MPRPSTKVAKPFNPAECFELHDISLWETSLSRENDYQPALHAGKCHVQTMQKVRPELYEVTAEGRDEELAMLRVFISLGVRSVFREDAEGGAETAIFSLEATYAVDYFLNAPPPSSEVFNDFVNFNCVHNVWPFWRQHVYDTLKRASLPVPTVPLFAGRPSGRPKKAVGQVRRVLKGAPALGNESES